jgi:hypothetical protein
MLCGLVVVAGLYSLEACLRVRDYVDPFANFLFVKGDTDGGQFDSHSVVCFVLARGVM